LQIVGTTTIKFSANILTWRVYLSYNGETAQSKTCWLLNMNIFYFFLFDFT
jgi:hypothetical protein